MSIRDLRPALRAFLLANAAIAATVAARIYPLRLPAGEKSTSLVYSRISADGDHHSEGASGLARVRLQLDAWAKTIDAATALADQVKDVLDGFRGSMGSGAAQVPVQGVFFDAEREDYDAEAELYRVSRDYLVWYEER